MLCKNPPLIVKFVPPIARYVDGAVSVPAETFMLPEVVAAKDPNVHEPLEPLLKVSGPNAVEVAMIIFCWVEVELNVTSFVPENTDVEDANQFPASVSAFASIVSIDVLATPSCRRPVARRRSPSPFPPALPWRVTVPPGA